MRRLARPTIRKKFSFLFAMLILVGAGNILVIQSSYARLQGTATLVNLIAAWAPPEMRQAAQGAIGSSAFGLGGVLGSLLAGGVLDRFGPRATWLSLAGVAALALAVAAAFLPAQVRRDSSP